MGTPACGLEPWLRTRWHANRGWALANRSLTRSWVNLGGSALSKAPSQVARAVAVGRALGDQQVGRVEIIVRTSRSCGVAQHQTNRDVVGVAARAASDLRVRVGT